VDKIALHYVSKKDVNKCDSFNQNLSILQYILLILFHLYTL